MPKLLHKKQNYRELEFVPIHTKVQQKIRRPCSQCGKWIYVIELGFCRYRFVEYDYTIEHNVAGLPWTAVVRKGTTHICVNDKDSPKNTISRAKNNNLLYNCRQAYRDRICINIQRQNDTHRMKPISVETM